MIYAFMIYNHKHGHKYVFKRFLNKFKQEETMLQQLSMIKCMFMEELMKKEKNYVMFGNLILEILNGQNVK